MKRQTINIPYENIIDITPTTVEYMTDIKNYQGRKTIHNYISITRKENCMEVVFNINSYKEGDLIKFTWFGDLYYGILQNISDNGEYYHLLQMYDVEKHTLEDGNSICYDSICDVGLVTAKEIKAMQEQLSKIHMKFDLTYKRFVVVNDIKEGDFIKISPKTKNMDIDTLTNTYYGLVDTVENNGCGVAYELTYVCDYKGDECELPYNIDLESREYRACSDEWDISLCDGREISSITLGILAHGYEYDKERKTIIAPSGWRAKVGGRYFYINFVTDNVYEETDNGNSDDTSNHYYKEHNYFKSRREAQLIFDKIDKVKGILLEDRALTDFNI